MAANSTMAAKFVALASCCKEAEWLQDLLINIHVWPKPMSPISVHCDSQSTLSRAYNQVYNSKSRHIGLSHRQVNQLINDGVITFQALVKETLVESRKCLKFGNDDFIRRVHILNAIPDPLLDVYQNYPTARELWKVLEVRFFMEEATRRLSRHTSSPSKKHWDAVNRVFKYLKKTMDYGLEYNRDPSVLEGYADASWITDQEDYQSLWYWLHATKKSNGYKTSYNQVDNGKSSYGNSLDKVHLSEYVSDAASYEFKGLALKHSEKPR
ncbi:hypothetical protein Tco_1363869 [Tanacetum coccineum]